MIPGQRPGQLFNQLVPEDRFCQKTVDARIQRFLLDVFPIVGGKKDDRISSEIWARILRAASIPLRSSILQSMMIPK